MMQKGGVKIWRPRQLYIGEGAREYQPILERGEDSKAQLGSQPTKVTFTHIPLVTMERLTKRVPGRSEYRFRTLRRSARSSPARDCRTPFR